MVSLSSRKQRQRFQNLSPLALNKYSICLGSICQVLWRQSRTSLRGCRCHSILAQEQFCKFAAYGVVYVLREVAEYRCDLHRVELRNHYANYGPVRPE